MQNLNQTILSQYANSPILLALIQSTNDCLDPSANITSFYNNMWNIATAQGYGLDVWGRIVGVNRTIAFPVTVVSGQYLGFTEANDANLMPFGQAPFYLSPAVTPNYTLSDTAYRALILTKALFNVSNSSIPAINSILRSLFSGRGNAYVLDLFNMKMRVVFEFSLQPYEIAIVKYSGAFVGPNGVGITIMDTNVGKTFGFAEAGRYTGFNNGRLFEGFE